MVEREIAKETSAPVNTEVHKSLIDDAYKFSKETIEHPDARLRQTFVAGYGAVIGGMKNIQELPNEFIHNPWETTTNIAKASIPGLVAGAVLTAATPEILEAARR